MKLLWIDLETSGLDPKRDRILEIAACVTTLDNMFEVVSNEKWKGTPFEHHYEAALHYAPDREELERLHPSVLAMHSKNGLFQVCRASTITLKDAEEVLLSYIDLADDVEREERTTLAGASVHFDLSFLREHMPYFAKNLSHRILDVSSVKLFMRGQGMSRMLPTEAHRAWPDVQESMKHAEACARWIA